LISTYRGNIGAWKIEKKRLAKNNLPVLSFHNRVIRGYLMSLVLLIMTYLLAGTTALFLFVAAGLWGKTLLEIVNYMEHYGIVRDPKTRVHPRHSWNTTKRVSSWAMFNLTRHSHHHAKATVPFHQLKPMANSPEMISGYLGTIVVAMIPPLWHKLMTPKVLEWDKKFSSEEEQPLIKTANRKSGIPAFQNS
jgi:alkane 1-monooxygenase